MTWQNVLEKSGIGLVARLAVALVLSILVFSVAYSEDISASCYTHCDSKSDCRNPECFSSPICKEMCPDYPVLINNTCFFGGNCSNSCSCISSGSQACPNAGTVINGTCYYGAYYGNSTCTATGCALSLANMSGNDFCNKTAGPQDTIGPAISEVIVAPPFNNGTFNISAVIADAKSPINASEYFLRRGNDSQKCGTPGSGVAINPANDSVFNNDSLVESVSSNLVTFEHDGNNSVCLQAQDISGNFGNCTCVNFTVDSLPPAKEGNISLNNVSGPFEELICNNSPVLNVAFCDSSSGVLSAEYFLDMLVPGFSLNVLSSYSRLGGVHCSYFSSEINLSDLADGVHTISSMSAHDALGNLGNYDLGANYSFVKDSMPPETEITFSSGSYWDCNETEANGNNLSKCFFVLNGTEVAINATDFGLQASGRFADNLTTHYTLWTRLNETENWTNASDGVYLKNETFNATLENNTYYLFEFWSEDICGFSEAHKFYLIIAVVPVCPDSLCRFGETSATCPSDCPSSQTQGSSSASSSTSGTGTSHYYGVGIWVPVNTSNSTANESVPMCEPNWVCGEWSACMDGIKTRDCIDLNNCTGEGVIYPEVISQCAAEAAPLGYCGDGICQAENGETEATCPVDCAGLEGNNIGNSPPTGNFFATPGLLSGLLLLLIVFLSAHLIYKRNKSLSKIKAK
jgi:hypothetical protein